MVQSNGANFSVKRLFSRTCQSYQFLTSNTEQSTPRFHVFYKKKSPSENSIKTISTSRDVVWKQGRREMRGRRPRVKQQSVLSQLGVVHHNRVGEKSTLSSYTHTQTRLYLSHHITHLVLVEKRIFVTRQQRPVTRVECQQSRVRSTD